ncbi:class I SAM-dependent methyltransferase [Candidatus Magnetominusculus dajiuhuensis]|uniref:class I SAM-dependent methyltransferase n=1 Tax=Candidatus Magnetominusculus dajiuhuensis TaxID=3137712 RepID=UPI003B42C0E1
MGWYEEFPAVSFNMIKSTGAGVNASIIDVGGGLSNLVDNLILSGYKRITVLDIASPAIEKAKERLGDRAGAVRWIEADITEAMLPEDYDVWHDRAVFHFLTDVGHRKKYINAAKQSLRVGGHLIIATFSLDGPPTCSGLEVVRYSPETLADEFGVDFDLILSYTVDHITPSKVPQKFIFCRFKRVR